MISLMHVWANRSRSHRANLRRMDCPRTDHVLWQAYSLALPMRVRDGERGARLYSHLRLIHQLRSPQETRSDGARVWQVDGAAAQPRQTISPELLALPMRVRKTTRGLWCQSGEWCVRVLWLHDWAVFKDAFHQTRHDRQQAVHGLVHHAATLSQSAKQGFSLLWRSRDPSLRALAEFRGLLDRYGAVVSGRSDDRARGQQRALPTWQLHLGSTIKSIKEQTPFVGMEAK